MLEFNAADFMSLMNTFTGHQYIINETHGQLPENVKNITSKMTDYVRDICDRMGLPISRDSAEYIRGASTSDDLSFAYAHVIGIIHTELRGRSFIEPDARFKKYYNNIELFGVSVFEAFVSANDDIYEAGMCLALERPTACVMHLMRVLEVGLGALAAALGVGKQNDWGGYLREINKELAARVKAAGARSSDEQFYAEAALIIDSMRRAWRNPTMHPEKSYSAERAEEILLVIKSFMVHLATKLHD